MSEISCRRCGEQKPGLPTAPIPGPTGEEIQTSICADCWAEWEKMEVMVINEYRLNFMDLGAQEILQQQMREFLELDAATD